MKFRFGFRQALVSGGIFVGLVFALASIDPMVQDRFVELVAGQGDVSSFAGRASELGGALATAMRSQSIENAPMVVFAAVGAMLFLFMVRT